jgi:hypothetical protein
MYRVRIEQISLQLMRESPCVRGPCSGTDTSSQAHTCELHLARKGAPNVAASTCSSMPGRDSCIQRASACADRAAELRISWTSAADFLHLARKRNPNKVTSY